MGQILRCDNIIHYSRWVTPYALAAALVLLDTPLCLVK